MDNYFNNTSIFKLIYKWRKHLVVITVIAGILATVFSGPIFITPLYRSKAVFYPTNLNSYSDESQTEQVLEWLNSDYILETMIQIFDLGKRYKIDKEHPHFQSTIRYHYNSKVQFKKTPNEAIQLEVNDKDPLVASQMADSIISLLNKLILSEHSKKYHEGLIFMKNRLDLKQKEIDSVAKQLYILSTEYGIIDYPNQSREVARGFLRTVDGNNSNNINIKEVVKLKKNIEEKGGEWVKFNDRYYKLIAEYGTYKVDYEWALANTNKKISFTTVVTKPFPSDKKVFPTRWLIIALASAGALIFSIMTVFIIDSKGNISHRQSEA